MTNLDSILKNRDIALLTKFLLVKAMILPVVTYGCESWTINRAERRRTDAFELWCWRTLESPLDCKEIKPVSPKGDQSWVFIGRTDVQAETPYFGQLIWRTDSLGKTLMLGKIEGGRRDDRGWDCCMALLTQWRCVWVNSLSWWWRGRPGMLQSMGHKELDTTEWLNWSEVTEIGKWYGMPKTQHCLVSLVTLMWLLLGWAIGIAVVSWFPVSLFH